MKALCVILALLCIGRAISEEKLLSRNKRYIRLNADTPVEVGALITLPISIMFPKVSGRSISFEEQERISIESLDPELFDEPRHLKQLDKMDTYFAYLSIPEHVCQQRILCEMANDPEKYSPISEIFRKQLQDPPVKQTPLSRYFLYWKAMEIGQNANHRSALSTSSHDRSSNACAEIYKACPFDGSQIFHTRLLQVLQFFVRYLKVELKEDI